MLGELNVFGEHFPLYLCCTARLLDPSYAVLLIVKASYATAPNVTKNHSHEINTNV